MKDDSLRLAGCIITDEKGRVLLLHRNTTDWQHWEVPGGKIEKNETPAVAAVRELKEELGIDVGIIKPLGQKTFVERGKNLHYSWFKARITHGKPKIMEPATFDAFKYHSLEDLKSENIVLSTGAQNFVAMFKEDTPSSNYEVRTSGYGSSGY